MNLSKKNLVILLLLFSIITSCDNIQKSDLKEWGLNNSAKIETLELNSNQNDLVRLKQIVGETDVVCLGESRHDIHEQFKLKHRFIKYLVEELEFNTFALEASLPYSKRINNYILNGTGDINQILSEMPGWFLWDTQEIKKLLVWLRKHNQSVENKVSFYGIDIVAPNDGLNQIFEYLQKVDSTFFEEIKSKNFGQSIIDDNHWSTSLENYSRLTNETKQEIKTNYKDLYDYIYSNKSSYISNLTLGDYEWILQLAYSAREANNMFSSEDRMQMGLIRDNAMANNSIWIKDRNNKMIIWAHNVHIAKSEFIMSMFPDTKIKGMGYILNQKLEGKIVSIGASFNEGYFENENRIFESAEPNSIDGILANLNMEYFIIDLSQKSENKKVTKWFNEEKSMRGQEFEMKFIPNQAFDAIFFTNTISKVKYNPVTSEKLRN